MTTDYREGYKNQLAKDRTVQVHIFIGETISSDFITLNNEGMLTVRKGYAWDGASGPTYDTLSCITASLVHDALYQLMREGKLDRKWRKQADMELYRLCRLNGMWYLRAKAWYHAVRFVGDANSQAKNARPIIEAP